MNNGKKLTQPRSALRSFIQEGDSILFDGEITGSDVTLRRTGDQKGRV